MNVSDPHPAFNDDLRVRQAALKQLPLNRESDKGKRSLIDPDDFASVFHLAPSYCHLLAKLEGRSSPSSLPFYSDTVLSELEPGTPTLLLTKKWFEWVYLKSSAGLHAGLMYSGAATAASEIIGLHLKQSQGEQVPRERWRELRRTLSKIRQEEAQLAGHLDIVAAMAWDLSNSPGAASDVLVAWESKILRDVDAQLGWTDQIHNDLVQTHASHVERACLNLGIQQSDLPKTDMKTFSAEVQRLWNEGGSRELLDRGEQRGKVQAAALKAWHETLRQHFLVFQAEQTRALTTNAEASSSQASLGGL